MCRHAKPHYFANVCLKINVKLGGINTVPDPRSVSFLADPPNPTMVMGCNTAHSAPWVSQVLPLLYVAYCSMQGIE